MRLVLPASSVARSAKYTVWPLVGRPETVTFSVDPDGAVVAGGVTWLAAEKFASVIGEVDQRRSMLPFGTCPTHQSSPTSVQLTCAVPGLAPVFTVRSSTVAGGRESNP